MKKLLYTACALVCGMGAANAQQQPQFSHYAFNGLYVSPAYAGIKGTTEFMLLGRYQYAGYDATFDDGGSPQTGLFTVSHPLKKINAGIGLNVMYDVLGPFSNNSYQLSLAKHFNIGSGKLSVGVNGTANRITLNGSKYRPVDPTDPNIVLTDQTDTKVEAGAGLWYQAENWYLGAGIQNLLGSEFEYKGENEVDLNNDGIVDETVSATGKLIASKHVYVSAGYDIPVTGSVTLTPTAILKYAEEVSYEAGLRATFNDKFWVGAGYRNEDAVTALVGLNLLKENSLRIGYAFDFVTLGSDAKAPTSHEIMLAYRIPLSASAPKPAIRTPRYSF